MDLDRCQLWREKKSGGKEVRGPAFDSLKARRQTCMTLSLWSGLKPQTWRQREASSGVLLAYTNLNTSA